MATLYMLLGKPYLGATEGNERAHVLMKKYFHTMCSHSNKRIGDVLQMMNLLHLRDWVSKEFGQFASGTEETQWRLMIDCQLAPPKRQKKDTDAAIPVSDAAMTLLEVGRKGAKEPSAL